MQSKLGVGQSGPPGEPRRPERRGQDGPPDQSSSSKRGTGCWWIRTNIAELPTSKRNNIAQRTLVQVSDAQTNVPVVLVVEDEFLIRFDTAESIREAGFEVLEAASANEAFIVLESRHDIRVVFTEIVMPGSLDGLRLARAVRERWPQVSIVATSADLFKPNYLPAGSIFLPKPYNLAMLGGTLRELAGL